MGIVIDLAERLDTRIAQRRREVERLTEQLAGLIAEKRPDLSWQACCTIAKREAERRG